MPHGKGIGYRCPECGGPSRVLMTETWEDKQVIVRKHECKACKHIFNTFQSLLTNEILRALNT